MSGLVLCDVHRYAGRHCPHCEDAERIAKLEVERNAALRKLSEVSHALGKLEVERDEALANLYVQSSARLTAEKERDEEAAAVAELETQLDEREIELRGERQARERAEAESHQRGQVIEHQRAQLSEQWSHLERAEAQAAAMRAALESVRREYANEGGYPEDEVDAALSSDAGAELLRFVQAAQRALRLAKGRPGKAPNPFANALALAPDWLREGKP